MLFRLFLCHFYFV